MSNQVTGADDRLLEPLAAYNNFYRSEFKRNCEECFESLVKQSRINVEENRKTVKAYRQELALVEAIEKKISLFRGLRTLLIVLTVIGFLCVPVGIYLIVQGKTAAGAITLSVGAVVAALMLVLLFKVLSPALKDRELLANTHRAKAQEELRRAEEQMAPLNALFEDGLTRRLIEKTVPTIRIDENFRMRRYDYLAGKYGYGMNDDENESVIGLLSGEILGNPFVEERTLVHWMGSCTYEGSLTITWTTTGVDSEGNLVTEHHSQILHASVTRPKPYYRRETRLVYGNEAAPSLHFSRSPSHVEDLGEKGLEKHIKKGVKELRKKQEEALTEGGKSFTEMGNDEFDVLFGALDRDNEVEFRLLFTPLAQKNMLALLKNSEGFGDDFRMVKSGCLNYIRSEHSEQWDMDVRGTRFRSYSVDIAKTNFLDFEQQYFECLYFDLAPLLSIPLYQQHKPQEYIYRDVYERNYTRQETEYAVNNLGQDYFAHERAATESILKTKLVKEEGGTDHVIVTAHAFEGIPRVEYVPVHGGDGYMHDVPVEWTEYLPVSSSRQVKVKEIGLSDRAFEREAAGGALSSALRKHGSVYGYSHGIVCCLIGSEDAAFDADFTIKQN